MAGAAVSPPPPPKGGPRPPGGGPFLGAALRRRSRWSLAPSGPALAAGVAPAGRSRRRPCSARLPPRLPRVVTSPYQTHTEPPARAGIFSGQAPAASCRGGLRLKPRRAIRGPLAVSNAAEDARPRCGLSCPEAPMPRADCFCPPAAFVSSCCCVRRAAVSMPWIHATHTPRPIVNYPDGTPRPNRQIGRVTIGASLRLYPCWPSACRGRPQSEAPTPPILTPPIPSLRSGLSGDYSGGACPSSAYDDGAGGLAGCYGPSRCSGNQKERRK